MEQPPTSVTAIAGFAKPEDVSSDSEITGMLRCKTYPINSNPETTFSFHSINVADLTQDNTQTPNLESMGFDKIDLSENSRLQELLQTIRRNDEISIEQAKLLRKLLSFSTFKLNNGKTLRFLYIAPEGLIMRKAFPNDLNPHSEVTDDGMNGHPGAAAVHGDQDINGTPLKQILKGFAPLLFRHNSPNKINKRSPIFLVNLWIPLQQITRPLILMDRRSLDNKQDQLRYSLPTDSFLDRKADQTMNDIWMFLHNENQQWYFSSEMKHDQAYIFDTLGLPHGAIVLPGEKAVAQYCQYLTQAKKSITEKNQQALSNLESFTKPTLPEDTTLPLKKVIAEFDELLNEAKSKDIASLIQSNFIKRCDFALDKVIRRSLEMRIVALVS